MKRLLAAAAAVAALALPAAAAAHPLGNFTTNHFSRIEIAGDRVYVTYVLDLAEIPTFQERGKVDKLGEAGYARAVAAGVRTDLALSVDGRRVPLRRLDDVIGFPPGAAGPAHDAARGALRGAAARARADADRVPRRQLRRPARLAGDRRQGTRRRAR